MTPVERAALYVHGLTPTQRVAVLAHLDQPELSVIDLARQLGFARETVRQALRAAERLLPPAGQRPTPRPLDVAREAVAEVRRLRQANGLAVCRDRVIAEVLAELRADGHPLDSVVAAAGRALMVSPASVALALHDQPRLPLPAPSTGGPTRRKARPLHDGTGLEARELAALARRVADAREAAGLDVLGADTTRLRAVVAALVRRGISPADVVAWAVRVPTFSLPAIRYELNAEVLSSRAGRRPPVTEHDPAR